jgi:hypothetical protein
MTEERTTVKATTIKASPITVRRLHALRDHGRFRSLDELLTVLARIGETRPGLVMAAQAELDGHGGSNDQ